MTDTAAVDRRTLLKGAGAAAVAVGVTPGGVITADKAGAHNLTTASGMPKPIVTEVPLDPANPNAGTIHWALPGPAGATTQILSLPAMGLDAGASTVGDFDGWVGYAVVAGEATGTDGSTSTVEFDVRAMKGKYVAEDGSEQEAAFAFL